MNFKSFPMREVLFMAKMGFLSKSLWQEFFARWSRAQNARNWNKLVNSEYCQPHDSKMLPHVLVLSAKAINELQEQGIAAVTRTHLGQFDHDLKVARIILGLENENILDGFTTEGELKKKFMAWMKTTGHGRGAKFPDLTIELRSPSKFKKVAIEVEQSLKSFDRYKQMMNSYANANDIETVVFVSNQQSIFNRIARAMKETHYPSWERPVGFGEMQEWLQAPMTAPIYLSRGVSSIREWITGDVQISA